MSFQTIIELNHQTVASLYEQDSSKAIESSSSALSCQQVLQRNQQNPSSTLDVKDCLDRCMLLSQPDHKQATSEMIQKPFIYDLGIVLPSTVTDHAVITPILIFNLALAHHQRGESLQYHDSVASYNMLGKARRLYELAHASITNDVEDNILFHFAVVNNIAVIDQKLGNTSVSNECFDYLMSLLMMLVDRGHSMRLRQVHGFLANVPSASTEAAAAAA